MSEVFKDKAGEAMTDHPPGETRRQQIEALIQRAFIEGFTAATHMAGTLSAEECWPDSHVKAELSALLREEAAETTTKE